MKRIALLAAVLLFASCDGEPTLSDPQLTFTSSVAASTSSDSETPQVSGTGGAIRVVGRYSSPCLGGTLHGRVAGSGRDITLVVDWQEPSGCYTAIGKHAYEAVIAPLEPGDYRLRVIHEGEAGVGDIEVFDGTVHVRHPHLR